MSTQIITPENFQEGVWRWDLPAEYVVKCRKKADILKVMNSSPRADGISITILKKPDGAPKGFRIGKYKSGQTIRKSFVITREALTDKFFVGVFNSLYVMVCTRPWDYVIVFGADHSCREGGGGNEGTKVGIPNPPPRPNRPAN